MRGAKREIDWIQYDALMAEYRSRRQVAKLMQLSESTLRSAEKTRTALVPVAASVSQGEPIVQEVTTLVLPQEEQEAYERANRIIAAGMKTFIEVGEALMEVRDRRLYRAEYPSFETYCERRWGFVRQQAYRLMDASTVVGHLREVSPSGDKLPENEAQARPLASLPPEEQGETWREVVQTAPASGITAAHVQQTVKARRAAREVSPIGDKASTKTRQQPAPRPVIDRTVAYDLWTQGQPIKAIAAQFGANPDDVFSTLEEEAKARRVQAITEIASILRRVIQNVKDAGALRSLLHNAIDLMEHIEATALWRNLLRQLIDYIAEVKPEQAETWGDAAIDLSGELQTWFKHAGCLTEQQNARITALLDRDELLEDWLPVPDDESEDPSEASAHE